MEEKLTTVVVPRSGGEITIRLFQPRDGPQVDALLDEGFAHAPDSPCQAALVRHLSSRVAYVSYASFAFGFACICARFPILRIMGVVLCFAGITLFLCVRRGIMNFFIDYCTEARQTDFGDITASYKIPVLAPGTDIAPEQGPAGLWVAVIEHPKLDRSEVVGCVGLDYQVDVSPSEAMVRRMIVSVRHRRRRIGSLLMTALLEHAWRHAPPVQTVCLDVSEMQPGAQSLYEKHGFVVVGSRWLYAARLFPIKVFRLERKVASLS
ncbi:acyl-CoA N-acyltransferase [Mycena crocata]|nr:acyl-CoA N-acyltransferase [Mycena crocata]